MEVKNFKLEGTLIVRLSTNIEDMEKPTAETLKFLLSEDLQDMGYSFNEIEIQNFKREIIK